MTKQKEALQIGEAAVADDRLSGWQGKEVEDFYDLIGEELVRETELDAESVDALGEETISVSDLAGSLKTWRFGHVIVDEAQDLTPMQWRMIKRRTTGGAITIVGDVAQRRQGLESWDSLVGHVYPDYENYELTINYRSPQTVQDMADRIAEKMGLASETTSIRSGDRPIAWSKVTDVVELLVAVNDCLIKSVGAERSAVIIDSDNEDPEWMAALHELAEESENISILTPLECKGLEFDHVVVVSADEMAARGSLSDLFVAVTRATKSLSITHKNTVPTWLVG